MSSTARAFRPMKSDQTKDTAMEKPPSRNYYRWTRSERDRAVQMRRNGVPIAEIAARFDRTHASVASMLQMLSRAPAPVPRSRARKFAIGAFELGAFLLILGVCIVALALL